MAAPAWESIAASGGRSSALSAYLANTNDFSSAFKGGSSLGALLGVDDHDYVDRRIVSMLFTRTLASIDLGLLQEDVGFGEDGSEVARSRSGLTRRGLPFLANHRFAEGRYLRMATTLELHPNVNGNFLEPDVGQLAWQRVEMTIGARRSWNNVYVAAHGDGSLLFGGKLPPPAAVRVGWRRRSSGLQVQGVRRKPGSAGSGPRRLPLSGARQAATDVGGSVIPGLSPGVSLGLQSSWTGASTAAASRGLQLLATPDSKSLIGLPYTTSRPTESVRATADLRATFFAGTVSTGIARPLDRAAGLRGLFAIGEAF